MIPKQALNFSFGPAGVGQSSVQKKEVDGVFVTTCCNTLAWVAGN